LFVPEAGLLGEIRVPYPAEIGTYRFDQNLRLNAAFCRQLSRLATGHGTKGTKDGYRPQGRKRRERAELGDTARTTQSDISGRFLAKETMCPPSVTASFCCSPSCSWPSARW